jgi:hypothetical protein
VEIQLDGARSSASAFVTESGLDADMVSGTITLADQHGSTQPSSLPRFAAVEAL